MSIRGVQINVPGIGDWYTRLAYTVNNILTGRTNNYGTVTLTASTTLTTVVEAEGRLSADSVIGLTPTTTTAAAELGTIFVGTVDADNNKWIMTHSNTADTDKIFRYTITG